MISRLSREEGKEKMKKLNKESVFDTLMNHLMGETDGDKMLEECMTFDVKKTKKIPMRYRMIALGFVKGLSLEEVNAKLEEKGCDRLYARNFWEAGLVYAFLNGLTYQEWRKLEEDCRDIRRKAGDKSRYFTEAKITFRDVEDYVRDCSDEENGQLVTRHLTMLIERQIADIHGGEEAFRRFLSENTGLFSQVREKARYYFCKYLYGYLQDKAEQYIRALETGRGTEDALSELMAFKNVTKLKKKKRTPQEVRELLRESGISSGEIFDAFNYFYFEYVSINWVEVLLEYYSAGDILLLPARQKKELADALRGIDASLAGLGDEEVIRRQAEEMQRREEELDAIYSLDGDNRGYQRNRSGENAVRDMIKGRVDIDRTTLICFLLFFAGENRSAARGGIHRERLDEILTECGFAPLREEDDFDFFVEEYLTAQEPQMYLMEEVTRYARNRENFYLYEMYKDARSLEEEFCKVMGIGA